MMQKLVVYFLIAMTVFGFTYAGFVVGKRAVPDSHVEVVFDSTGKPIEIYVYFRNSYLGKTKCGGELVFEVLQRSDVVIQRYRNGQCVGGWFAGGAHHMGLEFDTEY